MPDQHYSCYFVILLPAQARCLQYIMYKNNNNIILLSSFIHIHSLCVCFILLQCISLLIIYLDPRRVVGQFFKVKLRCVFLDQTINIDGNLTNPSIMNGNIFVMILSKIGHRQTCKVVVLDLSTSASQLQIFNI